MEKGELVERTDIPAPDCPDRLKDWYYSNLNRVQERVKRRIEIYENYYEVNHIEEKDKPFVNLRKEITYYNKKYFTK